MDKSSCELSVSVDTPVRNNNSVVGLPLVGGTTHAGFNCSIPTMQHASLLHSLGVQAHMYWVLGSKSRPYITFPWLFRNSVKIVLIYIKNIRYWIRTYVCSTRIPKKTAACILAKQFRDKQRTYECTYVSWSTFQAYANEISMNQQNDISE